MGGVTGGGVEREGRSGCPGAGGPGVVTVLEKNGALRVGAVRVGAASGALGGGHASPDKFHTRIFAKTVTKCKVTKCKGDTREGSTLRESMTYDIVDLFLSCYRHGQWWPVQGPRLARVSLWWQMSGAR